MEKLSLREFQRALSARLVGDEAGQPVSKLGVQAGAGRWLVDLSDAAEVIPVPSITRVPITRAWLVGLANVRGNLYAVADLSLFLGGPATAIADKSRLLVLGDKYRINCALLVDRVHGLFRNDQLSSTASARRRAWSAGRLADAHGNTWEHLNVRELAAHPDFLNVAA